ncbi:maleate cis-trans isomerase family protein [Roseobacteraceae bacterium S113]
MALSYHLDANRLPQVGFVVLKADETLERDMRQILPDTLEPLITRLPSGDEVSSESLAEMAQNLTGAARLFPSGAQMAAVGYGCTSGTAEMGAARVAALIRDGVATPYVSDPLTALIAACNHLNLRRIALISPYVESVSAKLRAELATAGITVTGFASFEEPVEANVVRIAPQSIADAARDIGQSAECDGVFLSCTNLRTLGIIEAVEAQIGKPVLSSNQVLAWHLLQLVGARPQAGGVGALFAGDVRS